MDQKPTSSAPELELSEKELRDAAVAAATRALRHIENAQNELAAACGELSRLKRGIPVWTACHKLTDKVHAFWYRVDSFRAGGRYSLDDVNVEALRAARARHVANVATLLRQPSQ